MSQDIHITDLAHPQLSAVQQAALDYGNTVQVDFSERGVLAAARERTGLADFGADDFRERLNLLLDEWGNDDNMTALQRANLFGYLVRYASNRLLIQDFWRHHPEALEKPVCRPIIVAGLPRSGTTHLLNLLAADTRFRSLPLWESYEPLPLPGEHASDDASDPRYQRCEAQWQGMQQTTPLLAAMHPMNPEHIHEELELMGPAFASYNFEWLAPSPRWRDHYYASDQRPHYAYMRDVLKLLQWRRGPERWVLKCPQHLEQLPVLHETFPDATIVITHRDPVAVIQSAVTMIAYGQRMGRKRIDLPALVDYWSDRVEHLLRACVADRPQLPEAQSIDVPFHEFMADDMAMVERIYATAGTPLDARAREQMQAFLADHPRGKEGRVIYRLKEDFGVDPAALRERFAFYFERSPVRAEV
ncbi:sulfotransferase family protein [Parahaliea aestuarii]|uniref:Sulfotransferase n=1 Tax=Parahaliea aestuarii TaxID=1852021 RepID=A0A5C9A214_9GAMM|nr:sulfotransferase [Parahaliea aestuarii]TXS93391.1 sulfotransferase [Parahaliea aestuarii]